MSDFAQIEKAAGHKLYIQLEQGVPKGYFTVSIKVSQGSTVYLLKGPTGRPHEARIVGRLEFDSNRNVFAHKGTGLKGGQSLGVVTSLTGIYSRLVR